MSDKRRKEVIRDLTITINNEKNRVGGNQELIGKLQKKLDDVIEGNSTSSVKNKKK